MRSGPKRIDITGHKFGRLTAISMDGQSSATTRAIAWRCLCECGNYSRVNGYALRKGTIKSCGCLRVVVGRRVGKSNRTHGMHGTPEYGSWRNMLSRCYDPNAAHYARYGGRGIEVWPEWRTSFQKFVDHVGPRPYRDRTIDRINPDWHYAPGNVRWADKSQQARNRSRNPHARLPPLTT